MEPHEMTKGQIARDRLRALVEFHGYGLYISRILLKRIDDAMCEELINDFDEGRV